MLSACSQALGPYIVVFKTHIDVVSDFSDETVQGLKHLSKKHNFLIFEDRKLIDIGNTVQKQYHGGALRISEWAHIVNLSILPGDGIVDALTETVTAPDFPYANDVGRAFLILAEMTSKGSLATGNYTKRCVELARTHSATMIGFVAVKSLSNVDTDVRPSEQEDFIVFTTGVNRASKGDKLGQQYQTPADAVAGGADFIIAGRGIYAVEDPVGSAKLYQKEGWEAYLRRVDKPST